MVRCFILYVLSTHRALTEWNNLNTYGTAMNLTVHSVMYTWYAATRTGWKSPKWLMMFVTTIQLVQMVGGLIIAYIAGLSGRPGCNQWMQKHPLGVYCALGMYGSYFVLFAKLFVDNYIFPKKKGGKKKGE